MNGSFTGPSIKQPALGTAQMRSGLAVLDLLRKSLSFLLVGALWGCSNAVLKKVTSPDAEKAADSGGALGADGGRGQGGIWEGLRSLARAKAALAFAVNQSGSVLFYVLLSSHDVSLAVPLCNSLTLVFTALTSHYVLGEELKEPRRVALGAALVLLGVTLCLAAK